MPPLNPNVIDLLSNTPVSPGALTLYKGWYVFASTTPMCSMTIEDYLAQYLQEDSWPATGYYLGGSSSFYWRARSFPTRPRVLAYLQRPDLTNPNAALLGSWWGAPWDQRTPCTAQQVYRRRARGIEISPFVAFNLQANSLDVAGHTIPVEAPVVV